MEVEEIVSNLTVELRRGVLILAVLHLLKEQQYGYSLLQLLEEKNIKMEANTLYPLLRRLETQGLLDNEWSTETSRPRKYYVLSTKGHEVLTILKQEWLKTSKEMSELLGGE